MIALIAGEEEDDQADESGSENRALAEKAVAESEEAVSFLFTGESGAGKSTLINALCNQTICPCAGGGPSVTARAIEVFSNPEARADTITVMVVWKDADKLKADWQRMFHDSRENQEWLGCRYALLRDSLTPTMKKRTLSRSDYEKLLEQQQAIWHELECVFSREQLVQLSECEDVPSMMELITPQTMPHLAPFLACANNGTATSTNKVDGSNNNNSNNNNNGGSSSSSRNNTAATANSIPVRRAPLQAAFPTVTPDTVSHEDKQLLMVDKFVARFVCNTETKSDPTREITGFEAEVGDNAQLWPLVEKVQVEGNFGWSVPTLLIDTPGNGSQDAFTRQLTRTQVQWEEQADTVIICHEPCRFSSAKCVRRLVRKLRCERGRQLGDLLFMATKAEHHTEPGPQATVIANIQKDLLLPLVSSSSSSASSADSEVLIREAKNVQVLFATTLKHMTNVDQVRNKLCAMASATAKTRRQLAFAAIRDWGNAYLENREKAEAALSEETKVAATQATALVNMQLSQNSCTTYWRTQLLGAEFKVKEDEEEEETKQWYVDTLTQWLGHDQNSWPSRLLKHHREGKKEDQKGINPGLDAFLASALMDKWDSTNLVNASYLRITMDAVDRVRKVHERLVELVGKYDETQQLGGLDLGMSELERAICRASKTRAASFVECYATRIRAKLREHEFWNPLTGKEAVKRMTEHMYECLSSMACALNEALLEETQAAVCIDGLWPIVHRYKKRWLRILRRLRSSPSESSSMSPRDESRIRELRTLLDAC